MVIEDVAEFRRAYKAGDVDIFVYPWEDNQAPSPLGRNAAAAVGALASATRAAGVAWEVTVGRTWLASGSFMKSKEHLSDLEMPLITNDQARARVSAARAK